MHYACWGDRNKALGELLKHNPHLDAKDKVRIWLVCKHVAVTPLQRMRCCAMWYTLCNAYNCIMHVSPVERFAHTGTTSTLYVVRRLVAQQCHLRHSKAATAASAAFCTLALTPTRLTRYAFRPQCSSCLCTDALLMLSMRTYKSEGV